MALEYMIVKVKEVHGEHILAESMDQMAYRLLTLKEDTYRVDSHCRAYIHEDIRLDKNGSISINRFSFTNSFAREVFLLLIGIKGIGTKGAVKIINDFGGTRNLMESLEGGDQLRILATSRKYAAQLISAMESIRKRNLLAEAPGDLPQRSIRSEICEILLEMNYQRERCLEAIDHVDGMLVESGGIEGSTVEGALRETLSYLATEKANE